MHLIGVEISAFAEPSVFQEIRDVHDEHVAFPMRHGISVIRRIRVLAMLAGQSVWEDAVGIAGRILIEEKSISFGSCTMRRGGPMRGTRRGGFAVEPHRIGLAFVIRTGPFTFGLKLGLIGGFRRGRQRIRNRRLHGAIACVIDRGDGHLAVHFPLEGHRRQIDRRRSRCRSGQDARRRCASGRPLLA